VAAAADPTLTSLDPPTAAEGSAQQDVYLIGTNFLSTSKVLVNGVLFPFIYGSQTAMRVTLPATSFTQAGQIPVQVQSQNGDVSPTIYLSVVPVRPAIVASVPDSVPQSTANFSVNLTGGFFAPGKMSAQFNGSITGVTYVDSRHLTVSIPPTDTPGLYPIVVQNSDAAQAGVPSMSAVNLAVGPISGNIPTAPVATVAVGSSPSAVAIDAVLDLAVVVNTGDGSASLIDLSSNTVVKTIAVGKQPTGVAIDDQLPDHLALVVNSADQTVSTIDLATQTVTSVLPISINAGAPPTLPQSIGINPLTHRAIVAYQSTNQAMVIDLVTPNPQFVPACTIAPCPVSVIGSGLTPYGTGPNPGVAIDPRLNWAVVTPGGSVNSINLVDLGRSSSQGDVGRVPLVIGSLSISATMQGVAINPETHQALLTDSAAGTSSDPNTASLTSFNIMDNTVNSTPFTYTSGTGTSKTQVTLSQPGFVAAAVNPLTNVGIAVEVNNNPHGAAAAGTATIVDLGTGNILQLSIQVGDSPEAVAVDPATNEAVVVNHADGTVSILSLGPIRTPHILEANPAIAYAPATGNLTLTITGAGFVPSSEVLLDGTPVSGSVSVNGRQIVATVPASLLGGARRYIVAVQNPGSPPALSNVTDLAVIQPVVVGNAPVGVAVDTDRDLAVVTNSADNTVSLVALTPQTPTGTNGVQAGAVGTIGSAIPVGYDPLGVAVLPHLGLAVVANYASNDASVVDVTQTISPIQVTLCSGPPQPCTGSAGVAIDQDTSTAVVTSSTVPTGDTGFHISYISLSVTTSSSGNSFKVSFAGSAPVDEAPTGVAVDPNLGLAAVAASQGNEVDLIPVGGTQITRPSGSLQLPAGVVFDPLNQVFLVASSSGNNIVIVDPIALTETPVRVGINPTSLDYNFQTSTLVTVNSASHTMSVLDYVCPPNSGLTCPLPQARTVLGLGGSEPASSTPLGPNGVAIDPRLSLAVVTDQDNNRILLVPLPH
jgi:YVTN family beta-propeller protein